MSDRLKSTLLFDESVRSINGVSGSRASALSKLKIASIRDLIEHYPRKYLDLTNISTIADAHIGEVSTIKGSVHEIKLKRPRRNLPIVEITLVDGTSTLIISVFHQPWLAKKIHKDENIVVSGKVTFDFGFKRMTNPIIDGLSDFPPEGRIIPVHRSTEKLGAPQLRRIIGSALDGLYGMYDPIPLDLRTKYDLFSKYEAIRSIHFPNAMSDTEKARERLAFEELLLLELFLNIQDMKRMMGKTPIAHMTTGSNLERLRRSLPFDLTHDQKVAIDEILSGMFESRSLNHMLLGDVGTGKTAVAAHCLAVAVDSGKQAMLIAPTEVLAIQHHSTLKRLFQDTDIRLALLKGSTAKTQRDSIIDDTNSGKIDVLIGTHALLEDDVTPVDLSLVVIDEQQRFGVEQRAKLLSKGESADALYLTATPIPRSLALAAFGNLTLSYLKEKPSKGAKRTTEVVDKSFKGEAYGEAIEALARGEQVYVVCPLVGVNREAKCDASIDDDADEPSIVDLSSFDSENISAAVSEARFLQSKVFPEYNVELLYGSMKSADKADVMERFREGQIDVLVSTTVIEVGVDVANATIMIVEDADRFGLAQLHQLRGRVGRGDLDSHVYLISGTQNPQSMARLKALEKTEDGFELAELDLALRGEGDILGIRQSGLSTLKAADLLKDAELIELALGEAKEILSSDPDLDDPEHRPLKREINLIFNDDDIVTGG